MAMSSLIFLTVLFSGIFLSTQQQQILDVEEQNSLYRVLDSINPTIEWRSLFPEDDFCSSPPHGVVCDYLIKPDGTPSQTLHITELSFGHVSDFSPNPPCTSNSTLSPLLFTAFVYLRKLFFYRCFTSGRVSLPDEAPGSFGSNLEELVFIENPSLVFPLGGIFGNFTGLRRLVLTGNGVYGSIPEEIGGLVGLEEVTLSRNKLTGQIPETFIDLKRLRILDLSLNYLDGNIPQGKWNLTELLKLDLSNNGLYGRIPESFGLLKSLEFLDLSFNRLGSFGVPLVLGKLSNLRHVYLSGNSLGGQIPDIWENLGGIMGIGFSNMGLVGTIPSSMGLHLKNLRYLGLNNNSLQGGLPHEFGFLESVSEINLENNNLSGRVPFDVHFTSRIGGKLRLNGNPDLCIDQSSVNDRLGQLKLCGTPDLPNAVLFNEVSSSSSSRWFLSSVLLCFLGAVIVLAE